jgi:hypothetical protein
MRNFVITLFLISVALSACENEANTDKNPAYIKTLTGGCNDELFDLKKSSYEETEDTVKFIYSNDTLDIFVGLNYICCAPFHSETYTSNDSIFIEITDTYNPDDEMVYCRCMCYYTWDFLFSELTIGKNYIVSIILNDPTEDNPIVIKEGIFSLPIDGR